MEEFQVIQVRDKSDIVEARMQVRTLARGVGLDLFDQARISLATSTLAIILGMESQGQGEISMGSVHNLGRVGLRVVCTKANASLQEITARVVGDTKQLVDELTVEEMLPDSVCVTLQKWSAKGGNASASRPSFAPPLQAVEPPQHKTLELATKREQETRNRIKERAHSEKAGQMIKIYTKFDIITARAAVRRFAAKEGFDVLSQISISLATWSMAHAMELGGLYQGQITVDRLTNRQGSGMRVVCTRPLTAGRVFSPEVLHDTGSLVDDLAVETLPSKGVQVTAIKWVSQR